MIKGLTFTFFGKKIETMAQTTTIPITTVAAMLMVTIVLTGTTNVVSVWAGTFPGPNGQIAFVSLRDGNDEIYVMDAEGGDQTNLSNNDADDFNPSWSPDGEMIAFTSDRDSTEESGPNFDIYVMNAADGSGQTTLTDNDAHDSDPDWGTNTSPPDGDGSSPAPSQQTTDEDISANTNDNTNDNTNYNNNDVLPFLIDVVECFASNDNNNLDGSNNNPDEQFSADVELCLYGVVDEYSNNDNNLNNNNGTSSQET